MPALTRVPAIVVAAIIAAVVATLLPLTAATQGGAAQAASAPAIPAGLTASATTSTAVLSWNAAAGADHYYVCLQTSKAATTCVKGIATTSDTVTFTGLAPTGGTDYFFRVGAYNGSGSSRSVLKGFDLGTTSSAPATPTGLTADAPSSTATLSWSAAAGASRYYVCLQTSAAATTCAKGVSTTSTTATFTGLAPTDGTDYFFRVGAYNAAGSSRSELLGFDIGTTSTPVETPSVPANVVITPADSSATVRWSASSNAARYFVCVLTSKTATTCAKGAATTTATSVSFTGLTRREGTDYWVLVAAYSSTGGKSQTDFLDLELAPAAPSKPIITVTGPTATVSWGRAVNADRYYVCLQGTLSATSCVKGAATTTETSTTFTGLSGDSGPGYDYYVRVAAYNASGKAQTGLVGFDVPGAGASVGRIASIQVEDVQPKTFVLDWSDAAGATSYTIVMATNANMLTNQRVYKPRTSEQSVPSLAPGTKYWVQIRGEAGTVKGQYSGVTQTTPSASSSIRLLTFNLCGQDHCRGAGSPVSTWKNRKVSAGKRIGNGAGLDFVATQESGRDTNFVTELPGYALASYSNAKSLFYRTDKYAMVGAGKSAELGPKRYAVWGEFREKATGNRFIVVDAHLEPYKGVTNDDKRRVQTQVLIAKVEASNPEGLPVVWAGDFNSNKSNDQPKYPGGYDAPYQVFLASGRTDSYNRADAGNVLVNASFNSANQAKNPAYQYYDHVDHVFIDNGIAVTMWKVVVAVTNASVCGMDLQLKPCYYATPWVSDHNPVQVNLTIPGLPAVTGG